MKGCEEMSKGKIIVYAQATKANRLLELISQLQFMQWATEYVQFVPDSSEPNRVEILPEALDYKIAIDIERELEERIQGHEDFDDVEVKIINSPIEFHVQGVVKPDMVHLIIMACHEVAQLLRYQDVCIKNIAKRGSDNAVKVSVQLNILDLRKDVLLQNLRETFDEKFEFDVEVTLE